MDHPQYCEWGWNIFQVIEMYCKAESGRYASVLNMNDLPIQLEDKMETLLMVRALAFL